MPNATIDAATGTATNGTQQAPTSKKKGRKAKIRSIGDASENGEPHQQQQPEQEQQAGGGGETRISSPSPSSPRTEEAASKNPYLDVISKRLKSEKKRLAKIEKAEETFKEPDGKSKLNEDQLRNLEKKSEVLAAIKTFEGILVGLTAVDAEESKAQKKRQKAEQAEREQAIVEAVKAAEEAFTESTIALLQFFRLDHYRQRGIAHLAYDQIEAVEKFRSLVTILVDSTGDDVERRKQTKDVLQHIEKLKTGSDEVINARTGQSFNDGDLQLSGITYGDLRSLAQNPPIFEQSDVMSPEMGKYSPYMTQHDDEIPTDMGAPVSGGALRFTTDVQIPSELTHDQEQSLLANGAEASHPPEMEEITPARTEPSSAIDERLINEADTTLQQFSGSYEVDRGLQYGAEHQQVDQYVSIDQQVGAVPVVETGVLPEQQDVHYEAGLAVEQGQQIVENQGSSSAAEGVSNAAEVETGDALQQTILPVTVGASSLPPRPNLPNQPSGPHQRSNSYHSQFAQGGYQNNYRGHRGGNNFRGARGYRNQVGGSGPNRRDSFGRGGSYRGYDHSKNGGFRGGRGNPNGRGGNQNFQGPRGNQGFRNRGGGQQ